MRTFADPHRCPDCGTTLAAGSTTCAACGIDLGGPVGRELFATLVHADSLLGQLRTSARARTTVPAGAPAAPAPPAAGAAVPPFPTHRPAEGDGAVRPSAVPRILLALGALCLVVAALVFLAVTWSVLGVGGRTAVLVLFTAAAAAVTTWSLRRGLRGTAEALGAVTAGLVTLDLFGARTSGWLGSPGDGAFALVVGLVLVVAGLLAAVAARSTEARRLTVAEVAAVLGLGTAAAGVVGLDTGSTSGRLLVAVVGAGLVTGAVAALHRRTSLPVALVGTAIVTSATWLALLGTGLDAVGPQPSLASVLGDLAGWPLLAAAAVAAVVAALRPVPLPARVSALAASLVALTAAVVAPAFDAEATEGTVVAVLVLVTAAAFLVLVPRTWALAGLAVGTLAALVAAVQSVVLLGMAGAQVAEVTSPVWAGSPGGRFPRWSEEGLAAGWLLPVTLLALAVAAWATLRLLPDGTALAARVGPTLVVLAAPVGGLGWLALSPVPVAVPLVLLLAAAVALVVLVAGPLVGRHTAGANGLVALGAATVLLVAALVLGLHDEALTALALTVALAAAVAVHLRSAHLPSGAVAGSLAGAVVPPLLAALTWTVGAWTQAEPGPTALVGMLLLAAVALGRGFLPVGERSDTALAALEVSALVAAAALAAAGLDGEGGSPDWLAGYLTLAGVAASMLAVLRTDRRPVGWLGAALLVAASWVRLADEGVEVVEAYTLPAALGLLVVGALRMRSDPTVSTHRVLGAGLGLALVPSLLVVLEEPASVRALLLGLGCLALVLVGVLRHWAAPLTHGAVVGLVLVLREAGPYLGDAVPRWAVIGAAGALLIILGVTWEQRLRDARAVAGYVRGLR